MSVNGRTGCGPHGLFPTYPEIVKGERTLLSEAGWMCGTLSLYFYLVAIRLIPLADLAVTTNALAAWWTLGERLSSRLMWAFPISFLGVALVADSHTGGDGWGYLAGLASAALAGSAYALLRKLRELPPEIPAMAFLALARI